MKLSRKRSQQLDGMSIEFKRMFDIESVNIVEIADSPPRSPPPVDDVDISIIPQTAKVRFFGVGFERKEQW